LHRRARLHHRREREASREEKERLFNPSNEPPSIMGLSDLIESLKRKAMSCDWLTDRMHNKTSKRAAVSSDTDGKQLATGNKKRRLEKGRVHKEEEGEEDESTVKKEEAIEDDLHQDKDEDSRKPPAVIKEEENETEDGEGILQLDRDEWEDSKKPPAAVKEEEGYGYETEESEDGEDVLLWGNHEWDDSKKPSVAVKKEVKDEVGHEYSPREIDDKSKWEQLATREENDDQETYLPDEITSTKGLLPPTRPSDTDTSVKTVSSPAMTVTKPKSAKHVTRAGARSKSFHKEKRSSTSLGEVDRSPMAGTDEDAFRRGIGSPLDETSNISDSVDGIVDQGGVIFGRRDAQWSIMFKKLQGYYGRHGHCELFWDVHRFAFILNTPTNTTTSPVSP
jgi:hypothetical protein